jgi:hypothetical protein
LGHPGGGSRFTAFTFAYAAITKVFGWGEVFSAGLVWHPRSRKPLGRNVLQHQNVKAEAVILVLIWLNVGKSGFLYAQGSATAARGNSKVQYPAAIPPLRLSHNRVSAMDFISKLTLGFAPERKVDDGKRRKTNRTIVSLREDWTLFPEKNDDATRL